MRENIGIILASVREGRRGEAFARWILGLATPKCAAELIDLRDWPLPGYHVKGTPATGEASYAAESLEGRWRDKIHGLDGFVIVTPEYNRGYPGQLKNAIDWLYPAWNRKPVAFVTYGGFAAGARAAEQLALVAVEVRMVPIRDQVNLKMIGMATDEHAAPSEEIYRKRADAMLDELVWFTGTLRAARASRSS